MMCRALLFAALVLFGAAPCFAQTVGRCPTNVGAAANPPSAWVLFDLGSAYLRADAKPTIAQAAQTAKARQVVTVCLVGQTDKLGDKAANEKLALARAQSVAAELIRQGYPAKNVVIATNPEAFGNFSLGARDASEQDRRVTIVFR